jgi:hypothetical protein
MRKAGIICFILALAITFGCGQSGKQGQTQTQSQNPPTDQEGRGQGFGPGQGGRGQFSPEDMAKRQVEGIAEYVKFTEGQEAKVYDLILKYAKKQQEMRSGVSFRDMTDEQRQEMRVKRQEMQTEQDKEMKTILTEEQFTQYEAYREQMRQMMQQRRPQ